MHDRGDEVRHRRHRDRRIDIIGEPLDPLFVGDRQNATLAGPGFCNIRGSLLEPRIVRRQHHQRHLFVDQGNRPVFHLARRITFRMDVGDLLELEGSLHGQWIERAARQIDRVFGIQQEISGLLDLGLGLQGFGHQVRRRQQILGQLQRPRRVESLPLLSHVQGEASHGDQLAGEGLG